MWCLIVLVVVSVLILGYRLLYLVEWRKSDPGRHAFGYVDEVAYDEEEPITEVLPVITNPDFYDPSFYRLGKAVRRWTDIQGHS